MIGYHLVTTTCLVPLFVKKNEKFSKSVDEKKAIPDLSGIKRA